MSTANAFCYGSSAVKLDRPNLVLIEGGSPAAASTSAAHQEKGHGFLLSAVVGVLVVFMLVCVGLFAQQTSSSLASSALESAPQETHVVRDGESLWSIAGQCDLSGVSTKDVVCWIESRNGLDGGLIRAGQQLVVPQGSLSGE